MPQPKVLYFEDDPFIAAMLRSKLEQAGFAVTHHTSPAPDPVAIAAAEAPQLILMDTLMPVMDGYRATELLKADNRTRSIPIFGLSNLGQQQDIDHAYAVGMSCYWIAADHNPDEVVQQVEQLVTTSSTSP